jgi:hypothetical protein
VNCGAGQARAAISQAASRRAPSSVRSSGGPLVTLVGPTPSGGAGIGQSCPTWATNASSIPGPPTCRHGVGVRSTPANTQRTGWTLAVATSSCAWARVRPGARSASAVATNTSSTKSHHAATGTASTAPSRASWIGASPPAHAASIGVGAAANRRQPGSTVNSVSHATTAENLAVAGPPGHDVGRRSTCSSSRPSQVTASAYTTRARHLAVTPA